MPSAQDGWYPLAVPLPISTNEYDATRSGSVLGICDHITDGTDSRDWLQHQRNGASVHFLIREEGGRAVVYQFMSVLWVAYGNGRHSGVGNPYMPQWLKDLISGGGDINQVTISIEHERNWPFSTPLPPVMLEASIALHRWICDFFSTIKRDRDHIFGHYQVQHIDRANCPGGPGGKLFQFEEIVRGVQPGRPPVLPPPPPDHEIHNGHAVYGNIYKFWKANGGIPAFGMPVSAEFTMEIEGKPYRTQFFERQWLVCDERGVVSSYFAGAKLFERIKKEIGYPAA